MVCLALRRKLGLAFDPDDPNSNHLNELSWRRHNRSCLWLIYKKLRLITVEPMAFLFSTALMMCNIVQQNLFQYKHCHYGLNYTDDICMNLKNYTDIRTEVFKRTSTLNYQREMVDHTIPIVFALFLGAWSDKYGRKGPMLLGVAGNILNSAGLLINSVFIKWKPEMVLLTAVPTSLLGGHLPFLMSIYSYLTDITTINSRSFRMSVLSTIYYLGYSAGSYLAAVLMDNYGFIEVFGASTLISIVAFLYCVVRIKESRVGEKHYVKGWYYDICDWQLLKHNFTTVFKRRAFNARLLLMLSVIIMIITTTALNGKF